MKAVGFGQKFICFSFVIEDGKHVVDFFSTIVICLLILVWRFSLCHYDLFYIQNTMITEKFQM